MVKVLLDTCVLAEIRHPRGRKSVKNAVSDLPDEALFLSVLTIGEVKKGVSLLPDSKRRRALESWLRHLEEYHAERILSVDLETAQIWSELSASAQRKGSPLAVSDGLIAATALRHGLHVMTRNVKDFAVTGAMLLNPWD